MFKKGDIVEYDDNDYINKVKLLSEVKFDYYTTPYSGRSDKPYWHCKVVFLFCIDDDLRLSVPFKIGKPIKRHTL
jgi:hypothetical protein